MHKKYKEKLFILTIALTLLLAACSNSEEVHETNMGDDDQINISGTKEENSLIIETSPKLFFILFVRKILLNLWVPAILIMLVTLRMSGVICTAPE